MADENLNPVGTLKITECAMNMMDQDGNIGPKTWFAFRGLGFDSAKYGDRISFFASTITGADDNATGSIRGYARGDRARNPDGK